MWAVVNEIMQWVGSILLGLTAWRLPVHQKADRFGDEAVINTLERVAPEVWNELMRHSRKHGISDE
jgi:hypothetical protein